MTNLDIKISIKILANYSKSLGGSLDKKELVNMLRSFSYYVSELYLYSIDEKLNSSRYKGKWEPVEDEGYREYLGTDPQGDIFNHIREAMEVKKIGTNFIIRINPYYKYPNSKLYLVKVIRSIESGTSDFRARPLISKNARWIRDNLKSLWKGYLTIKRVI